MVEQWRSHHHCLFTMENQVETKNIERYCKIRRPLKQIQQIQFAYFHPSSDIRTTYSINKWFQVVCLHFIYFQTKIVQLDNARVKLQVWKLHSTHIYTVSLALSAILESVYFLFSSFFVYNNTFNRFQSSISNVTLHFFLSSRPKFVIKTYFYFTISIQSKMSSDLGYW